MTSDTTLNAGDTSGAGASGSNDTPNGNGGGDGNTNNRAGGRRGFLGRTAASAGKTALKTALVAGGITATAGGVALGLHSAITSEEPGPLHAAFDTIYPGDLPYGLSDAEAKQFIKDVPTDVIQTMNEIAGVGASRAAGEIGFTTVNVAIEQICTFINHWCGGGGVLMDQINNARAAQGLEPVVQVPPSEATGGKRIMAQSDFDKGVLTDDMDNSSLTNDFLATHISSGRGNTTAEFVQSAGEVHSQLGTALGMLTGPAQEAFSQKLETAVADPSLTTDTARLMKIGEMLGEAEDSLIASGTVSNPALNKAVLAM